MSETHTPISEKRVAANRANARKSTGPRTGEGKAKSALNSVKHGFRSSSFAAVRLEKLDEVENLRADAVTCYKPVNAQELAAVERIALSQQQILRGARLDAGMFTSAMNDVLDHSNRPITPMDPEMIGPCDIEITRAQNRNYCVAEGFRRLAKESNIIGLTLRYRAQAEREYRRAIEDFERLKSLRAEMPNEPNVGVEPEVVDDLAHPKELNSMIIMDEEPPSAPSPEPNAEPARSAESAPQSRPSPSSAPSARPETPRKSSSEPVAIGPLPVSGAVPAEEEAEAEDDIAA
jgi:hypothetical protein